MSTWVIISWICVALLTGGNIFAFWKLKQASEQMLKMAFPGAKNMNEALSQMQNLMGGMGMGGAGKGGMNPADMMKAFGGGAMGGAGFGGMGTGASKGSNAKYGFQPKKAITGPVTDDRLKAAMELLQKSKNRTKE